MIVPLSYRPGILRDGSTFQGDYCTDGQWIRFVAGNIRKMKGQLEITNSPSNVTHLQIVNSGDVNYCYYATDTGVYKANIDLINYVLTDPVLIIEQEGNEVRWQSTIITKDASPFIVFFKTYDENNILSSAIGDMYTGKVSSSNMLSKIDLGQSINNATGGIIFSNPNLYLFGSNGTIYRSRTNDPVVFEGGDSDTYVVSTDKILYGAQVRGGTNTPSFLFWTQNAVIYLTNVSTGDTPVDFQKEIVSTNTSLISSRAIVQFDSLFFWLGNDRIFVYNGIVDAIPNTINLDYFINNVDFNKRQKIFGYKIARYGEVRWAYPEKRFANNPDIGCTRELVYNVRENSWYDTVIQRDCVFVFEGTGDVFTYGDSCTNYLYENEPYKAIWKHETGTTEIRTNREFLIPSYFTSPFYGLAAFDPARSGSSTDEYLSLERIEPDFQSSEPRTIEDFLNITIGYKKYASNGIQRTNPVSFSLADLPDAPNLGKIDFRVQARFMNITFQCSYDYSVGTILLTFKGGDFQ